MLRRKKLLKMGKVKSKPKTAEQLKYDALLATVNKNLIKRKKDKLAKEQSKQDWIDNYSKSLKVGTVEARDTWANGSTTKRSVFDPIRLNNIDIEETNKKRQEAGIYEDIETAAINAQEEAHRKATRIAPAYSKGAYQFLGNDKQVLKDIGKKTQQMD